MEQKDILNLISNDQRKYFGLQEIEPNWKAISVTSPNYQGYDVTIFTLGQTVKKCIIYGQKKYKEMQLDETLSKNLDLILPKTENKKPSTLDSIINKSAIGITLSFDAPNISIYNESSNKMFYMNYYDGKTQTNSIEDFKAWVENWCENSKEDDIVEINEFAKQKEMTEKSYNEGDVFRVKLSRNLYGYGRILLDYNKMRKNHEPFWDCLMGTPIVVSLYHILTENKNVTINELKDLKSFPSEIIMDNNIRCGNYEIIGNIPVDYEKEEYPIMYGTSMTGKNVNFQKGKTFLSLENTQPIAKNFKNNGVAMNVGFDLKVMKQCIEEKSNLPFYENGPLCVKNDLRNPINAEELKKVLEQFSINN